MTYINYFACTERPRDARFFGKEITRAAQNSCNFWYLIGQRQDDQKIVLLKVSLHKFVHLKYFWTQFKNMHLQGPCSLRPCISRPYCSGNHIFLLYHVSVRHTKIKESQQKLVTFLENKALKKSKISNHFKKIS